MSSDEGMTAFVAARLDEEEARANAMEHFIVYDDTYYSCPATRTEPHGDLEWGEEHCDCGLAERKAKRLREIAAMRAVLALHKTTVTKAEIFPFSPYTGEPNPDEYEVACEICGWADSNPTSACVTVRILAAIWSDNPDYRDRKP